QAPFTLEIENFLHNVCSQISIRIEHEFLTVSNQNSRLYEESQRLYGILLNSISHELRTPLTAITGAASGLLDDTINADPRTRSALAQEIALAGGRLNRLVDNLLDMSRLESGRLKLNMKPQDAGDLVSVVIRRLEKEIGTRKIHVAIAEDMPLVQIDFSLMEQTLVNILYNAIMYTPDDTDISVEVLARNDTAVFTVRDNGPGIEEEDIPHLFDKFRRGSHARSGGTGLGLSICRGIVEAHGGCIRAGNNPHGGAFFSIELPITAVSGGEEQK
ncbi:MAG: sensor histidine kinase, partial [Spirochaetota bacterium]